MKERVQQWLARFGLDEFLHAHVEQVVLGVPDHVRDELLADRNFRICDYEPRRGAFTYVPVGLPSKNSPGRSVVLKRTLRHRPASFVCYVIAHELAHAHLRNEGRWPGEDPEVAADAMAADWGYPRP